MSDLRAQAMRPLRTSIPLLERGALLKRLQDVADDTLHRRGRLVCVLGEGGAGKSTLLRALADDLQGRVRLLWAACEDMLIPEPLGPIYDWSRQADSLVACRTPSSES